MRYQFSTSLILAESLDIEVKVFWVVMMYSVVLGYKRLG